MGSASAKTGDRRVGAVLHEEIAQVALVRHLGFVERGVALLLLPVYRRPPLEEQPAQLGVVAGGGAVQRLHEHVVAGGRPRVRAGIEQHPRGFGRAEERREVQRGEAVRAPRGRQARVAGDELSDAVSAPERRRFEHIELRIRREDRVDIGLPALVQGLHEWADRHVGIVHLFG